MDKILDFNELFFGDITEYKKLGIGLMESLRNMTSASFWSMDTEAPKGLSTIVLMEIMDVLFGSFDKISDNLYSNDLITHEFPYFLETKEMVECLLLDPLYESDDFLNLAITIFSDFFTLLEIKLLLFDGCELEIEAPQKVLEEYDNEFSNYIERFDKYRDEFIELHK